MLRLTEAVGLNLEPQFAATESNATPSEPAATNHGQEAPLLVIRDAASENETFTQESDDSETVIGRGIITADEAKHL